MCPAMNDDDPWSIIATYIRLAVTRGTTFRLSHSSKASYLTYGGPGGRGVSHTAHALQKKRQGERTQPSARSHAGRQLDSFLWLWKKKKREREGAGRESGGFLRTELGDHQPLLSLAKAAVMHICSTPKFASSAALCILRRLKDRLL